MHETRLRVRFDEVDLMGVVHNARLLVYFEVARTAFLRHLGLPYSEIMRAGTQLAVIESGVRYLRPARYDEELVVATRVSECSGARVGLAYEVRRGEEILATGFTRLAAITPDGRPTRLPRAVRAAFEGELAAAAE